MNVLNRHNGLPLLGFAAFSGTGKTTLLSRLLPILKSRGIRIGMVKHAHHDFEIDTPGKDSFVLRKAGAAQMLIASDQRLAILEDYPQTQEPELNTLIQRLDCSRLDMILVEGFRHQAFSKIELHRPSLGKPLLAEHDPHIIAIACDAPPLTDCKLPLLDINQPESIADFILSQS